MKSRAMKVIGEVLPIFGNRGRLIPEALAVMAVVGSLLITPIGNAHAQESRFFRIVGPVPAMITGVTAEGAITWTNQVTNATFTVQTASVLVGRSNWVDYLQVPVNGAVTTWQIYDAAPPLGMEFIPAGTFTMGASPAEDATDVYPLHSVYVSAFYLDRSEVTKALWDEVRTWGESHGYSFSDTDYGSGNGPDYPVESVTWYGAVKWSNARSEKEGRTPVYYTDAGLAAIYKTGKIEPYANWSANGYRLPTEAEWEKAARGGLSGHRFPWGDTETISHNQANYYSYQDGSKMDVSYDISPTAGWHPIYRGSSPVGSFAPNGYGLYDMAGNVSEWCWDWTGTRSAEPQSDPHGPPSGERRALRSGNWNISGVGAMFCRVWVCVQQTPISNGPTIGFRCARSAGQ